MFLLIPGSQHPKKILLMFQQPINNCVYDKDMGNSHVWCYLIPELHYKHQDIKATVSVVYWKVALLEASERHTCRSSVAEYLGYALKKLVVSKGKKK